MTDRDETIAKIVKEVTAQLKTSEVSVKEARSVALGSDHGGFPLKETLRKYLEELGYKIKDCGPYSPESCDYPDYAHLVAEQVASGESAKGIMIDGAGMGSCIVCNKVPGIRAALAYDSFTAKMASEHDDANVLCLGGQTMGDALVKDMVKVWLETKFAGGRHGRRVDKMMGIEKKYMKEPR
jgi:ribose 5-phosphate isomerase B